VVEDGNIITGQNPASSKGVAQKIIELVKRNKYLNKLLQPVSN
jgi:putative intracellular protease/amidase